MSCYRILDNGCGVPGTHCLLLGGQPGLQTEFKAILGCIAKPYLRRERGRRRKRRIRVREEGGGGGRGGERKEGEGDGG